MRRAGKAVGRPVKRHGRNRGWRAEPGRAMPDRADFQRLIPRTRFPPVHGVYVPFLNRGREDSSQAYDERRASGDSGCRGMLAAEPPSGFSRDFRSRGVRRRGFMFLDQLSMGRRTACRRRCWARRRWCLAVSAALAEGTKHRAHAAAAREAKALKGEGGRRGRVPRQAQRQWNGNGHHSQQRR